MKKFAFYGLIAVSSFMGFLIIFAPASLMLMMANNTLAHRLPQLQVTHVSGTLWQGEAHVQYDSLTPSQVRWQVKPAALLKAQLQVELDARGEAHELYGQLTGQPSQWQLQRLSGNLGSDYLNPLARRYGLQFDGALDIHTLQFGFTLGTGWFNDARGNADWSGGQIQVATNSVPQIMQLPAMNARLDQDADALQVIISAGDQALLDINLKPTGWVVVSLQRALFQTAGLQLPPGAALPGDLPGQASSNTVVKFEEKLF